MKATATAPANIAFIKYWGKADPTLRIPLNSSISMNLSGAQTMTTVEFLDALDTDEVRILDGVFSEKETDRVVHGLDRIRERVGRDTYARVVTKNTFPKGAGSAASASGFAALALAGFAAAGTTLSEKELTTFARLGSGSACRSIPDGYVMWEKGTSSETSSAYSLYPHDYWDLRDVLVIVDSRMKKVSTSEGMETIQTSPLLVKRLAAIPERLARCKRALEEKNLTLLGEVSEEDCLDMHAVMQSQNPPLLYWNDATREIMEAVRRWRLEGLRVYFTIDAGPNVHLICEGNDEKAVAQKLRDIPAVESVIINKPAGGARLTDQHLF